MKGLILALLLSQVRIPGPGGFKASGGTFTLRYATPATSTTCTGTTCAVSLTSKPIVAGDLLGYQCALNAVGDSISSVTNGGTFVPVFATTSEIKNANVLAQGYILSASAESTTATITFASSSGTTRCVIWDYSYTGTPVFDGWNGFGQVASSTTLALPAFTPSSGSNNDIYLTMTNAAAAPASVNSGLTLVTGTGSGFAHIDNTISALGPTFTFGSAQTSILSQQMQFGFNVTPFSSIGFTNFSGTNGATVTQAALQSSTTGFQGYPWNAINTCASGNFTFQTSASLPLTGSTGRLNDGSNSSDSSTTGLEWPTSCGPSNAWEIGDSWGVLSNSTITTGINMTENLPGTDFSNIDSFVINGTANNDFNNAIQQSSGSSRTIDQECQGQTAGTQPPFNITSGTSYHLEMKWNPKGPISATFTNGSAVIGATNTHVAGDGVRFTTTGGLPTNFATNTTYYVIATGLSSSQMEVSTTVGGSAVTAGSAGSGTQTVSGGSHYLKIFTGYASPSSPGTLAATFTCPSLGFPAANIVIGNSNSNPVTTGFFIHWDTLLLSLDGTDPI